MFYADSFCLTSVKAFLKMHCKNTWLIACVLVRTAKQAEQNLLYTVTLSTFMKCEHQGNYAQGRRQILLNVPVILCLFHPCKALPALCALLVSFQKDALSAFCEYLAPRCVKCKNLASCQLQSLVTMKSSALHSAD